MFVLKIIGGLLVVGASWLIGYVYSRDCARRPQELRLLQNLLQVFESDITFMSSRITDAFERLYKGNASPVGVFFEKTCETLKGSGRFTAAEAWEEAVKSSVYKTALNREDEQIILAFGKLLGNSDLEGQVKNIRLTLAQLKMQEQKAEDARKKNETMYKSLGLLGGLAIVIVIF